MTSSSPGQPFAVATVIKTWGSSPRPAGSQLVVQADGRFEGSVSGGCIEGEVVEAALEVLQNGQPRLMAFGVTQESAWKAGLACGGRLEVLVEAAQPTEVQKLHKALREHKAVVRAVRLPSGDDRGEQRVILGSDPSQSGDFQRAARRALTEDRALDLEIEGDRWFFQPYQSPLRLIVVGAVHIAISLVQMAQLAGYNVTLIDPRSAFLRAELFPGTELCSDWPDEVLERLELDRRTAIVTLTHDPKLDDPSLEAALASPAFYIGSLGSRKTHAGRLARLAERGHSQQQLARIHGPVGLALGASSPEEIAISILAQMTQTLRRPG